MNDAPTISERLAQAMVSMAWFFTDYRKVSRSLLVRLPLSEMGGTCGKTQPRTSPLRLPLHVISLPSSLPPFRRWERPSSLLDHPFFHPTLVCPKCALVSHLTQGHWGRLTHAPAVVYAGGLWPLSSSAPLL